MGQAQIIFLNMEDKQGREGKKSSTETAPRHAMQLMEAVLGTSERL